MVKLFEFQCQNFEIERIQTEPGLMFISAQLVGNVNIISVGMFNSSKRANIFKPLGISLLYTNTGLADKNQFYQTAIIYLAFVLSSVLSLPFIKADWDLVKVVTQCQFIERQREEMRAAVPAVKSWQICHLTLVDNLPI